MKSMGKSRACEERFEAIFCLHANMSKVFASPARLKIMDILRTGERPVGELVESLGLSQPNISQHLAVLRANDIVASRKEGTTIYYRAANKKIYEAFDIIEKMIIEQLRENAEIVRNIRGE